MSWEGKRRSGAFLDSYLDTEMYNTCLMQTPKIQNWVVAKLRCLPVGRDLNEARVSLKNEHIKRAKEKSFGNGSH